MSVSITRPKGDYPFRANELANEHARTRWLPKLQDGSATIAVRDDGVFVVERVTVQNPTRFEMRNGIKIPVEFLATVDTHETRIDSHADVEFQRMGGKLWYTEFLKPAPEAAPAAPVAAPDAPMIPDTIDPPPEPKRGRWSMRRTG